MFTQWIMLQQHNAATETTASTWMTHEAWRVEEARLGRGHVLRLQPGRGSKRGRNAALLRGEAHGDGETQEKQERTVTVKVGGAAAAAGGASGETARALECSTS